MAKPIERTAPVTGEDADRLLEELSRTASPEEMERRYAILSEFRAKVTSPKNLSTPEPPPVPNTKPAVWDLVIADAHERNRVGTAKYGTPLQAGNGRDALVDAYQEALDLVVYLRQAIAERDEKGVG